MNEELEHYVRDERRRGVADSALEGELRNKGWDDAAIASVLTRAGSSKSPDLPTLGVLLADSWNELLQNFWKAALIMLVPIILAFAVGVLGGLGTFLVSSFSSLESGMLFALLGIAVASLVFFAMLISTIMLIIEIDRGWTLSYGDALRAALPILPPLLLVAVLLSFAVVGGFLLFIVPGVIACVWFGFAQIAVVVSGKRGWSALGYSRMLVFGRFLTLLWYFFATMVIVSVASAILNVIPIVGALLGALATPFLLIFSVRVYRSLISQKGDSDASASDIRTAQLFALIALLAILFVVALLFARN